MMDQATSLAIGAAMSQWSSQCIEGGLWPLFWMTVVICGTFVYVTHRRGL
jgi:hypothetical protein